MRATTWRFLGASVICKIVRRLRCTSWPLGTSCIRFGISASQHVRASFFLFNLQLQSWQAKHFTHLSGCQRMHIELRMINCSARSDQWLIKNVSCTPIWVEALPGGLNAVRNMYMCMYRSLRAILPQEMLCKRHMRRRQQSSVLGWADVREK